MNIEMPYDPWAAAAAPAAGQASPSHAGAADGEADAADGGRPFRFFGDDGVSFADLIDIVNPLQHVPVIGHLYRGATGDSIDPGSRLLGGTLFFGPLGALGAGVDVLVTHETGKDVGGHVASLFTDDDAPAEVAAGDAAAGAAPLAAAGTDGSHANGTGAGKDAISAWARGELAWAEAQAAPQVLVSQPGSSSRAPAGPAAPPLPDADRWLRDRPSAPPAAAGSIPPAPGSWFSETVLSSAADRYRAAQRLTAAS